MFSEVEFSDYARNATNSQLIFVRQNKTCLTHNICYCHQQRTATKTLLHAQTELGPTGNYGNAQTNTPVAILELAVLLY